MMPRGKVLDVVSDERRRQDAKWGEQNHPDGTGLCSDKAIAEHAKQICDWHAQAKTLTWRDILHEEVMEAFAETDPVNLRAELIQVAAVAVNWIEAIDRRGQS